jgi:hypothetical protein
MLGSPKSPATKRFSGYQGLATESEIRVRLEHAGDSVAGVRSSFNEQE